MKKSIMILSIFGALGILVIVLLINRIGQPDTGTVDLPTYDAENETTVAETTETVAETGTEQGIDVDTVTITNDKLDVRINKREEQQFHVDTLDEDIILPEGPVLGLYMSSIKKPAVLKLQSGIDGPVVRNFWNLDQLNAGYNGNTLDQCTGNDHILEFELSGEVYSCTSLLSRCTSLIRADLSGCNNKYGFYQFQLLFEGCISLKEVLLPENIREISMGMFMGCEALEKIELKEGLEVIDAFSFAGCKGLGEIRIPDTVRLIGEHAFDGCDGLVIDAVKGSAAYKYAKDNNIRIKGE